tara:strand:- start:335 stop:2053 length:1719 start_codon:yes stop_codon:yes gene_type:complete
MAGNIQESIDFDGDLRFSGKDLDITWAYLQIKTLFDAGIGSITSDNFRDKVIEQYNSNKSNGIAESNNNDIKSLPGKLSLGLPLGVKQINFQKRWTLNDMWNSHDVSGGRNSRKPTDVWESIVGEIAGTTENFAWTSSKNPDAKLNYMGNTAKVSLLDKGTIRSDKSWTLHFRAKIKKFDGVLFTKGNDTSNWGNNPFFQVKILLNRRCPVGHPNEGQKVCDKIAVSTGVGVHNYFMFPDGTSDATYNNKLIDFYFVREGQNVRMFIDSNQGGGPRECKQEIVGALPELINMTDLNAPLVFTGSNISYLEDVWVADNEFTADDVPYIDKPATRYRFAHDLNLETSYFAWKNLFQDRYSNYGQIFNYIQKKPEAGQANNQGHWTTDNTSDGNAFGWQTRDRVLKLDSPKKALQVNNVNFNSNFTVSFWVRTEAISAIVKFVGQNDTFRFQPHYDRSGFRLRYANNKNKNIASSTLSANPLKDTWYHITLVKNRNLIGLWINGEIGDYDFVGLTDAQIQAIGWTNLEFRGDDKGVYYSDVRVLDYAMCNVPAKGYGTQSTYEFIDQLKQSADIV